MRHRKHGGKVQITITSPLEKISQLLFLLFKVIFRMRRAISHIPRCQAIQSLRRIHIQRRSTNRRQECVKVVSCQMRTIWPFSESESKPKVKDVAIQMPKKIDAEKKDNNKYDRKMDDILNAPVGSMQSSTWLQAEKMIEHTAETENIAAAFRLLDRLAKEPDAKTKMNLDSIFSVVHKWFSISKQKKKFTYPPLKVWQRIEDYQKAGIAMDGRTYHRVIEALAIGKSTKPYNQYGPVGPVLAETILERMMELSKHENPALRPSTYTFNAVLLSWQNAGSKSTWASNEAPQKCLALLNKLKMLYDAGWGTEFMPERDTYRRVMNAFAHKGDGDQVEALLEEMYERYLDEGKPESLVPTKPLFTLVLYAWSKSKDPMAAERASVILERMLEMESSGEIPGLAVTASCFNIVMICFSRQRTKEAAIEVQKLFDRLVELSQTDEKKNPIGGSYTALIGGWSHCDAAKAEETFWHWKDEHDKGNVEMRLDSRLLGTVVASCYKSKTIPDNAERCDRLLQYALNAGMFEPSVVIFNMTINAFCRKKTMEGVERAEALLRQMEHIKDQLTPTVLSYVPIIHTWASLGRMERAEELLFEWYGSSNRNKKTNDAPSQKMKKRLDTQTFNHVLKAWLSNARTKPEAATRAEDLLLSMRHLGIRPNALSFQLTLQCRQRRIRRHKNSEVADPSRADDILQFLKAEYKSNSMNEAYLKLHQEWSMISLKQRNTALAP